MESIPTRKLKIGTGSNVGHDTQVEFDVGLGASNPKLSILAGALIFALNKKLDITGDLAAANAVFSGNVEIQGTQTYLNTTDLLVEDKNISLNYGGTTAGAAGAGFEVLGTSNTILATMKYDSTLPSNFKSGPNGAEKAILVSGEVVNADIKAGAAIAYSKLNLGLSIVNADIATGAAIAGTKIVAASPTVYGTSKGRFVPGSDGTVDTTAGNIGFRAVDRTLRANAASTAPLTTTVPKTVCVATIPSAGLWLVFGSVGFIGSATTTANRAEFSYGANTFNLPPNGVGTGFDESGFASSASHNLNNGDLTGAIPCTLIRTTAAQSIWIVASATFSSGSASAYGRIEMCEL